MTAPTKRMLDGFRILDMTRVLPGSFCTMLMADHGAEVIRIEEPKNGDPIRHTLPKVNGYSMHHLIANRGKKSITLNLKEPVGQEIFIDLVKNADVVVEGFRPGVMDRLGLGYERLRLANPGLVYAAMSSFGQNGPYRDRAAHNLNMHSIAGVLSNTSPPAIPGVQVADQGGALMLLSGILMALLGKTRTGRGDYVDISMTDSAFIFGLIAAASYAATGKDGIPGGERVTGGHAAYQIYRTRDDRFISIAAMEPKFWAPLCKALSREDLIAEQNATPQRHRELIAQLQEIFASRDLADWEVLLEAAGTCYAPVLSMSEAFVDPQLQARKMIIDAEHPIAGPLKQLGQPIKLTASPGDATAPAPELGAHNEEIFTKLGYSKAALADLRRQGVI